MELKRHTYPEPMYTASRTFPESLILKALYPGLHHPNSSRYHSGNHSWRAGEIWQPPVL